MKKKPTLKVDEKKLNKKIMEVLRKHDKRMVLSVAMRTALRKIADKKPCDGRSGLALQHRGLAVWLKAERYGLTPAGRRKLKEIGK